MKKNLLLLLCVFVFGNTFSQAPQKMSYQAVVRNSSNSLVSNSNVGIKISILQGSANGNAVYSETHTTTTNANGLATIEIGNGTVLSGTFGSINWGQGPYFIKSETDINGGSNYTISATSQLLSVPYALYAENSGGMSDYAIFEEQYPSTNIPTLNSGLGTYISNIHNFNTIVSQRGNSIILNSFSGTITLSPGKYKINVITPTDDFAGQSSYLTLSGTLSNIIYSNLYRNANSYHTMILNLDGFLDLSATETFTLNQFIFHNSGSPNTITSINPIPGLVTTTVAKIYIYKL